MYSEVLGREVEVPDEPRRIVSLSPAITEILYRLGLEDRIVGVSFYCNKPPRAREKPRVGSYYKVLYDKLEELKPDLVLTTTGAQRKVLDEIVERGFTLYPVPLPVTIHGIIDEVKIVGIITGAIEESRRLAKELESTLVKLRGSLKGIKLYYEIFLGGPVSAGAHSYIEDLFNYLGALTPFSRDRVTWVINPDPARIIEFNPDIILYERSPYADINLEKVLEGFKERGLDKLDAVKNNRIILLDPDTLAHYGPSIFTDTQKLVQKIRAMI